MNKTSTGKKKKTKKYNLEIMGRGRLLGCWAARKKLLGRGLLGQYVAHIQRMAAIVVLCPLNLSWCLSLGVKVVFFIHIQKGEWINC